MLLSYSPVFCNSADLLTRNSSAVPQEHKISLSTKGDFSVPAKRDFSTVTLTQKSNNSSVSCSKWCGNPVLFNWRFCVAVSVSRRKGVTVPICSSLIWTGTTEQNHAALHQYGESFSKQPRWILVAAQAAALPPPPPHCATELPSGVAPLWEEAGGAAASQLVIKAGVTTRASHRHDCYHQAIFVFLRAAVN